jgi:hypothetical protein
MNNNNNNEQIDKLEREIWLFQQWLKAIDDQQDETQNRIQHAYKECIDARLEKLAELESEALGASDLLQLEEA